MNMGEFLRRHAIPLALLAMAAGCVTMILSPIFFHQRNTARRVNCQSSLHDIMKACLIYQTDYAGHYPPLSDGSSRGWTTILQNSVPSQPLSFSCPNTSPSSYSATSDYFYNAHLATRKEGSIREPSLTIAFGEGPDNGPSNSHYWQLPNDYDNPDSVMLRHDFGSNYAFADGHVKTLSPKAFQKDATNHYLFDVSESQPVHKSSKSQK